LKPYFSKILKKKKVTILIQAEFQNNTLVSQLATSSDLGKINRKIIDVARFRFASSFIHGSNSNKSKTSLLDIYQLQSQQDENSSLYETGEELLDDLLNSKKVIHYRQLRYLAEQHESAILKLRFVLNPFSFVFLLAGDEQYHLVMETLDTREATYLWHMDKDKQEFRNQLHVVDHQLNIIRNDGRQAFLDLQPANFSRILHDYIDEQKGFILWKDLLEERLV